MTSRKTERVSIAGIIAVLREREYELIDKTTRSWVFRSKNPDAHAFALPNTREPVPVELVRHALHSESLSVDELVVEANQSVADPADDLYREHDSHAVLDSGDGLKVLGETPHPDAVIAAMDLAKVKEFTDRVAHESRQIRDEDRVDISGNLKEYLYGGR